jgi:hypothetical protein
MDNAVDVCTLLANDFEEFREADIFEKVKEGIDVIEDAVELARKCNVVQKEVNDVEVAFIEMWEAIVSWTKELRDLQHSVQSFAKDVVNDIGDEIRSCSTSAVMKAHRCARSAFRIFAPDSGIVDRDFMIWPQTEIDNVKDDMVSCVDLIKKEVASTRVLRERLVQDAQAVQHVFDDTKQKWDALSAPVEWYDILSLGITKAVQAVDFTAEFFDDFGHFVDIFVGLKGRFMQIVDGLKQMEQQADRLWEAFLKLGNALCSFAGIAPPDGYDNPQMLDLHFDSTSNTFLNQAEERIANFSVVDSCIAPCRSRLSGRLEDLRLSCRLRLKELVVYRVLPAEDPDDERSGLLASCGCESARHLSRQSRDS